MISTVATLGPALMQAAIEKSLKTLPFEMISKAIEKKFEDIGYPLTSSESQRLRRNFRNKKFNFRIKRDGEQSQLSVSLSKEERDEIYAAYQRVLEQLPEIFTQTANNVAPSFLESLEKRWKEESGFQRKELNAFKKRLNRTWNNSLDKTEMLIAMCREIGATIRADISNSERPRLHDTVTRLHARACQVAAEALCLLRSGFPEGALARWRTLYEISVVIAFLSKHGEETATRYTEHQMVETRKAAREYMEVHEAIRYQPIASEELTSLDVAADALIQKYGPSFAGQYGWAAKALDNKRPAFVDLDKDVQTGKLRSHYRWASQGIHATSKGIYKVQPMLGDADVLLAGPTNGGLAEPGHAIALALATITADSIALEPNMDLLIASKATILLCDSIGTAFSREHHALANKETKLRRDAKRNQKVPPVRKSRVQPRS